MLMAKKPFTAIAHAVPSGEGPFQTDLLTRLRSPAREKEVCLACDVAILSHAPKLEANRFCCIPISSSAAPVVTQPRRSGAHVAAFRMLGHVCVLLSHRCFIGVTSQTELA